MSHLGFQSTYFAFEMGYASSTLVILAAIHSVAVIAPYNAHRNVRDAIPNNTRYVSRKLALSESTKIFSGGNYNLNRLKVSYKKVIAPLTGLHWQIQGVNPENLLENPFHLKIGDRPFNFKTDNLLMHPDVEALVTYCGRFKDPKLHLVPLLKKDLGLRRLMEMINEAKNSKDNQAIALKMEADLFKYLHTFPVSEAASAFFPIAEQTKVSSLDVMVLNLFEDLMLTTLINYANAQLKIDSKLFVAVALLYHYGDDLSDMVKLALANPKYLEKALYIETGLAFSTTNLLRLLECKSTDLFRLSDPSMRMIFYYAKQSKARFGDNTLDFFETLSLWYNTNSKHELAIQWTQEQSTEEAEKLAKEIRKYATELDSKAKENAAVSKPATVASSPLTASPSRQHADAPLVNQIGMDKPLKTTIHPEGLLARIGRLFKEWWTKLLNMLTSL
ncbi:hypothetical protein CCR75_008060 [Bremia lactucae]|uniref:Uncharacterized protein n=1 Tax=Bremia lactucae TaxID=4779 RepID=A0A976FMZ9_BRELC|nr:hypothetical protein CCR75_008060 [Bremia lactucae]